MDKNTDDNVNNISLLHMLSYTGSGQTPYAYGSWLHPLLA